MSGGVDSAVAALLVAERRRGRRGHARTVVGPRERRRDAAAARRRPCAARASSPTASGMPHLSIDLRDEFRAGVVDGWLAGHAAGLTPNPCMRCNGNVRLDAMLELAERLGARDARDRPLRARRRRRAGAAAHRRRSRPRTRATCSRRSRPTRSRACASRSASCTSPRCASWRARPASRSRGRRDSQDLCFLAGTGHERLPGAPRRARAARPGRSSTARGASSASTRGAHVVHRRPAPRARHRRRHAAVRARRPTRAPTPSRSAARDELLAPSACACASSTLHRDGGVRRRCARALARAAARRAACTGGPSAGRHARASSSCHEPAERTAPGQLACLYAGELVVGYGTIAA